MSDTLHPSREKLLNAALQVIRAKGYTATRIEDICEVAGLTKGSFFHHFKSKEELAVAAAQHWSTVTAALFEAAPYNRHADPLERVLGYLDYRKELLRGTIPEFTCLVGTMVQEAYDTEPAIRDACNRCISEHAAGIEQDIAEAMVAHGVGADWTAKSLALHTQAVLQGAFILAKAKNGPAIAAESVDHLRRYVELLFNRPNVTGVVMKNAQKSKSAAT
jgi:TetR/AcrR family transcriptional regulator, transcriptional repressor for nem operon